MSNLQKILSKISLVKLISEDVALEKCGFMQEGICPFCKSPSRYFHVRPCFGVHKAQTYECHDCHEFGDALQWLKHFKGMSTAQAWQEMSMRTGIQIEDSKEKSNGQQQ